MGNIVKYIFAILFFVSFAFADDTTSRGFVPEERVINTASPLSGGGDLSADRTIAIQNAAADGATKGAVAFNAANFSCSSGICNTIQDIDITASPTFAGLTVGSLTGIIKGSSGTFSTATSGVDYENPLTFNSPLSRSVDTISLGTVDISSNTNLAASSPVTLTGDTVSFDFSTNNTWTGTNLFENTVTIGSDGSGDILVANSDTASYPILTTNPGGKNLRIGPAPLHLTLQDDRDGMGIINNTTSTAQSRGLVVWAEYAGTSNRSANLMGFNSFAHWESDFNLTGTMMGGRNGVRIYGASPTIAAAYGADVFLNLNSTGSGILTEWVGINGSQDTIGTNQTVTRYYGGYLRGVSMTGGTLTTAYGLRIGASSYTSGTFTNNYGLYVDELSAATNNYEAWFAGGGEIFFRDSAIHIGSLNDGYFDITADTGARIHSPTTIDGLGSFVYPFDLNVTAPSAAQSYILISNSYGTDYGAFFGLEGSGASGDDFSLYNWQAGPIKFFTDTSDASGSLAFIVQNTGDVGIRADKKFYFETSSSGTPGDTYMIFDSASNEIRFYVNGVLAGGFK